MKSALKRLGWTKAELGKRLGKSADSVSRWGEDPPRYVWAYLDLALELKRIRDAAQRALDQCR